MLPEMTRDPLQEEEVESRWEAAPAVVVVIGLQLLLALVSRYQDWQLWIFPWWVWLIPIVPELLLLVALSWSRPRRRLEQMGKRRTFALALLCVISLADGLLLVGVLASLVQGTERSGSQLLLKGFTVWGTSVITFGLAFWEFDRGGPVRRRQPDPPLPDFLFPQLTSTDQAPAGWQPEFFDYLYVSFTNSIAFSPTDTMPLSRWAKQLMLSESVLSAVTILLVAARAVNIFD
jgi:hypothetical protein